MRFDFHHGQLRGGPEFDQLREQVDSGGGRAGLPYPELPGLLDIAKVLNDAVGDTWIGEALSVRVVEWYKVLVPLPYVLMLVVLILVGIRFGIFTPTEASVVAVFYALVCGKWIYRTLEWKALPHIAARSAAGATGEAARKGAWPAGTIRTCSRPSCACAAASLATGTR